MPADMLTSREVAAYLGIHEKHVYRLLRQGRLPGTRVTGRWVFSRRLVKEWIEASSREAVKSARRPTTIAGVEPHHLTIVGSDDLLLQILQREFNRRHPSMLVTSALMSSMAGLEAVKERRAHVAGIHLLDPASGEYNRPHVAAAFGQRRALLVTLAHRQEGLMLPPSNPRKIRGLADIVRLRLRLAGRELGSGVRALQDHLLGEAKRRGRTVQPLELQTHLEVATAVVDGRADAGIGVQAAARSLGLEVIPLALERYDLMTTEEAFYHRPTQTFFEMIKSDWLRRIIANLPGYDARETGLLTVVQPEE